MKKKYHSQYLILFLALMYSALFVVVPVISNVYHEFKAPVLEKGVIDLDGIVFDGNKEVYLTGEWEYFDNKLIYSENIQDAEPDGFVSVPHAISRASANAAKSGAKNASYRIQLLNCKETDDIIVIMENFPSAFRVYLNGTSFMESGSLAIGEQDADVYPFISRSIAVALRDGSNEIVIEVSGHLRQGLSITPVMRNGIYNYGLYANRTLYCSMLLGICLLIAIFYVADLLFHTHKGYSFFILCTFLLFFIRSFQINEMYTQVHRIIPFIPFDKIQPLSCITGFLSLLTILLSLKKLLGITVKSRTIWFAGCYALVAAPLCLWIGIYYLPLYSWLLTDLALLPLVYFIYWKIYHNMKERKPYLIAFSIGYTIVLCGFLIDDLTMAGLTIRTDSYLSIVALLLFMVTIRVIDTKKTKKIQEEALQVYQIQARLKEAQLDSALHQIQPHFLYNTLQAIKTLCRHEPEQAEKAIYNFSLYLRDHMDCLESQEPVPFVEALDVLKAYTDIEKMRFEERLQIIYDIQCRHFRIPPLVLQPLVENAIRHGVCTKPEGGTVTLKTAVEDGFVVITITDDGVGFDESRQDKSGIGIQNVRYRLENMVRATLTIEGKPGQGTIQTIKIPWEEACYECDHC